MESTKNKSGRGIVAKTEFIPGLQNFNVKKFIEIKNHYLCGSFLAAPGPMDEGRDNHMPESVVQSRLVPENGGVFPFID